MYIWNSRKLGKQHILSPEGKSWCNVENSGVDLNVSSMSANGSRKICSLCARKASAPPKKKKKHKAKKGSPKYRDNFYRSMSWKKLRYKALKFNNGKCELCGASKHYGAVLNVDHIKPRKHRPDLELKLSNLQVLCASCNMGKCNDDDTDWREPSLKKLMGEEM
ncbi:MAG: HNH endonuclease [Flavobacteriales bacterium]|nr:HNH endonuclease [Flavobacteriales bacterium]